jgi:hypothetical protein
MALARGQVNGDDRYKNMMDRSRYPDRFDRSIG